MTLEEQLDEVLHENYRRCGKETGYWGRYFLREMKKKGGLQTLKRMLRPAKGDPVQGGWQALMDAGRVDLSVEATALDPRFATLLSAEELKEARRRLDRLPEYLKPKDVDREELHPMEVSDDTEFTEGAVRQIMVNAYERDRAARAACIAKFGLRCAVCDVSFAERYGEIGKKFIHVHHKKPLAMRRKEYKLRPTIDLVPVCPNCHAMLHTKNPPLAVDDLRAIYQQNKKD